MEGQILFILAAIVLVAVLAYFAWQAEKKRREALAAFARRHGLSFDPDADSSHDERYAQFELFRRGHSRVARNTMAGEVELFARPCRLCCGDFRYKVTSGSGKHRRTTTHDFSYLIVHPPWRTPPLLIRPEGLFDKIAGALGFDDIDFESAEFSRKFFVKSPDKRFAYDVLHPRMMEFLLDEKPSLLDIEDGALCLSDGGRRWAPEEFEAKMAFVTRFCDLWPRHLLEDLDR